MDTIDTKAAIRCLVIYSPCDLKIHENNKYNQQIYNGLQSEHWSKHLIQKYRFSLPHYQKQKLKNLLIQKQTFTLTVQNLKSKWT